MFFLHDNNSQSYIECFIITYYLYSYFLKLCYNYLPLKFALSNVFVHFIPLYIFFLQTKNNKINTDI